MPVTPGEYEIKPTEDGKYQVVNTVTGEVHAKATNKDSAQHQRQLLYAVAHGWHPTDEE